MSRRAKAGMLAVTIGYVVLTLAELALTAWLAGYVLAGWTWPL